jgi:hypothetical protein
MGITSRMAQTLFSSDTLTFAAQHQAKSDRNARQKVATWRPVTPVRAPEPRRTVEWPCQPASEVAVESPASLQFTASTGPLTPPSGRIKLPCLPIEGDPTQVSWVVFRETYASLAEAAFSRFTLSDWRRAESILDEEFSPKFARDISLDMLAQFEDFVCQAGYSKHRVENMASRLHHMILWGCEAGYLEREAFGVGSDFKWPPKPHSAWTKKLATRQNGERGTRIRRIHWREARRQYEQCRASSLDDRMHAIAFDDFERLCGCPPLAEVPGMIDGFVDALRREGVDRESLAIYREAVERLVDSVGSRRLAA